MTERPILFNGAMTRALLDGRKGQTRRLVKSPHADEADRWNYDAERGLWESGVNGEGGACAHGDWVRCPFGTVGDRLWVRETWQYADWTEDGLPRIRYQANAGTRWCERIPSDWCEELLMTWGDLSDPSNFDIDGKAADRRWRPSIHMPSWASRLTLEITGVRVERLQDITEADAQAEGVEPYTPPQGHISPEQRVPGPGFEDARLGDQPHRLPFADLWEQINGDGSWDANPWVWALTFKRVEANRV